MDESYKKELDEMKSKLLAMTDEEKVDWMTRIYTEREDLDEENETLLQKLKKMEHFYRNLTASLQLRKELWLIIEPSIADMIQDVTYIIDKSENFLKTLEE